MSDPTHAAETAEPDASPSRSARRRDALDVLAFARQLVELAPAQLAHLALPGAVQAALVAVQRTPSHIARKRELGHLAKVLRAQDAEALEPARAALASGHAAATRDAAALHRAEALREQLLDDHTGPATLTALIARQPGIDVQRLRALIRQARRERGSGQPPRAQRELFRLLRGLPQD